METNALLAILLSALLVCTEAISPEEIKILRENNVKSIESCAKEGNVSTEILHKIKLSVSTNSELPEEREARCLVACHIKNMGLLNADGSPNYPKLISTKQALVNDPAQADKVKAAAEICMQRDRSHDKDMCDTLHGELQCYYAKSREMNIESPGIM